MGGEYTPTAYGEFRGFDLGLESDMSVMDLEDMEWEEQEPTYFIGVGMGFVEGREMRQKLLSADSVLSIEERIECYQFVRRSQRFDWKCYQYWWEKDFLSHIGEWANSTISDELYVVSINFLAEEKLQRALDIVLEFYRDNYFLKAYINLLSLKNQLSDLRRRKQKQEITETESINGKIAIGNSLKNWLDEHKEKS